MRVVGLDLSLSSTGIAVGDRMGVIRSKNLRSHERIAYIRHEICNWLTGTDAVLAVVEGPAFGAAANQGGEELSWLRGRVLGSLWAWHIPYAVVTPSTLKMFATGNGAATKEDMLLMAETDLREPITGPVKASAYDMADAYWLAALGRYALAGFPHGEPGEEHPAFPGGVATGREREACAGVDWTRCSDLLDSLGITPPPPKPKPVKRRKRLAGGTP